MGKKKEASKTQAQGVVIKPEFHFFPSVFYILLLFWFTVVILNYLKFFPIQLGRFFDFFSLSEEIKIKNLLFLFSHILHILKALLIFVVAFGLGEILLDIFNIKDGDFYEEFILSTGIGLVILIYFTLCIGIVGFLNEYPFVVIGGVGLICSGKYLLLYYRERRNKFRESRTKKEQINGLIKIFLLLVIIGLVYTLVGALTPEIFYDSLKYHLAVPKYWIQHHKIFAIPNFEYSFYPVNIHLLYLIGLMFSNEITVKCIHFCFGLLLGLTIFHFCKRYFSSSTGIIASFIFYTIPFVCFVMWKSAIELGLAFFETLAVLYFIKSLTFEKYRYRYAIFAGIFCGTAIGGKYLSIYSLIAIFVLSIIYMLFIYKKIDKRILLQLSIIASISISLVSPYLVRNFLLTGIPTYPYIFSLKKDITVISKGEEAEFNDPGKPERTLKNFITLPWFMSMGKKTQEPFCGGALLLLLPLPFMLKNIDPKIKFMSLYALIYYFCWFFVRTYFRYMIPLLPVISVVFAYFLCETKMNNYIRMILLCGILVIGISNLCFVVSVEKISLEPIDFVLGMQSKKEYLSTQRQGYPCPYYQTISWANEHLPKGSKILFLGECRGYYCEHKFVTQTVGDLNPLILMLRQAKDEDELYDIIKKNGITHILLNVPEAKRLAQYDILHFEGKDLEIFIKFWNKYVKEIYRDIADSSFPERGVYSIKKQLPDLWDKYVGDIRNYVYLYEILPLEEAKKVHSAPYNFFLSPEIYKPGRWQKIKEYFNFK